MKLIGKHNIENALAAAALVGEVCGVSINQIAAGLARRRRCAGGCKRCEPGQPFAVLVDYAHTDDALENVLSALRPLARGNSASSLAAAAIAIRIKRPRMAKSEREIRATRSMSPATIRAPKIRMTIIEQIVPGFSKSKVKPVCDRGRPPSGDRADHRRCRGRAMWC